MRGTAASSRVPQGWARRVAYEVALLRDTSRNRASASSVVRCWQPMDLAVSSMRPGDRITIPDRWSADDPYYDKGRVTLDVDPAHAEGQRFVTVRCLRFPDVEVRLPVELSDEAASPVRANVVGL